MISLVGKLHAKLVFDRRVRVLASEIADLLPENASVVDVGCGDGRIAQLVQIGRSDVTIEGIDVMIRPSTRIPVREFDGAILPFADKSRDVVVFIDVLHHTLEPGRLVLEAARVARKAVVIKDHVTANRFDSATLALMDWVGNAPHGVRLPYNYLSEGQWRHALAEAGLTGTRMSNNVALYPWPLDRVFGRNLHFVGAFSPEAHPRMAA